MRDIHCHLLYGIDDGPTTIEESKRMLKKFYYENINEIVVTPHFISNSSYDANNMKKISEIQELEKFIKEEDLGIKLYIGNEIYIYDNILTDIGNGNISTINNSRYLLIEFPMNAEYNDAEEVLRKLISVGAIPIIAHPERYTSYTNDFNFFERLIRMGCLMQGNLGSLIGIYGRNSQLMLEEMLKRDMIHFLATDAHRSSSRVLEQMGEIKEKLFQMVGQERFQKLTEGNFEIMIKG